MKMKTTNNLKLDQKTLNAFKEAKDISNGKVSTKRYKNVNELRKDLKV